MRTDLYTKIVLTVIAIALTLNLVKDFDLITSAKADAAVPIPNIVTSKAEGAIDVNLVSINGYSVSSGYVPITIKDVSTSGYFPVEIKGSRTLDVNVTNTRDFK